MFTKLWHAAIMVSLVVSLTEAATTEYAWDPSTLADGAAIPAAAGVEYKLHYGPNSRGSAQRGTFTYPQNTPATSHTTGAITVPGPANVCVSVTAVATKLYIWTVGPKVYAIAPGESDYSNEVCTTYPPDPVQVPAPKNFRTVPKP